MLRARLFGAVLGVAALTSATAALAETIKVGVSAGPHAQIMEQVKPIAAQKGLDVEIIEFTDYVIPNQALSQGDLQANSFQHEPYLDNQVRDRGYEIVNVGKTVVFPMGIYSKTVKSLGELKEGARIAVPNDPTNGGRALLLLQANGLIKLRDGAGLKASPVDVVENPKRIELIELDAAQLPRSLDDVDAAAVNTNYAMESGLDPNKDAIARESADSPYTNVIAVRAADKDKPWVATFLQSYHSPEVKRFVLDTFKGAVVPGW
ncbi:MetQ/NlpA family ABC transporter substrate-binding protein [Azospirillum sp. ST 5-10]|uniref:MetQ/NlpA family ABC transporter substrate-binding protein n=1 Tax=unclassified Azospirillum TaxID=2630922 RepID=UPI003F49C19F